MALGSTQLLKEGGRCLGLTLGLTLPPSFANCLEVWDPNPEGTLWLCNRPVRWLLYILFQIKYNACIPKIWSLLYEYCNMLCGLVWINFYSKLLATKILVLWCKPCIFLSKTSVLVTTYQVTRCRNRSTPTNLPYRILMVNYLRFNLGIRQSLSALLFHTWVLVSYCPQVSLYFNFSMYFYTHLMRFFGFIVSDKVYLDILMLTALCYHHHHHHHYHCRHRVHIY